MIQKNTIQKSSGLDEVEGQILKSASGKISGSLRITLTKLFNSVSFQTLLKYEHVLFYFKISDSR